MYLVALNFIFLLTRENYGYLVAKSGFTRLYLGYFYLSKKGVVEKWGLGFSAQLYLLPRVRYPIGTQLKHHQACSTIFCYLDFAI